MVIQEIPNHAVEMLLSPGCQHRGFSYVPGAAGLPSFMNTSMDCVPQGLHPAIPTLGTLLLLASVLLNGASFWVFCCRIKQWDPGMILQFSLVLGDVLIIPVVPLRISYLSLGNWWPFGQFLCQFEVFLHSTHVYSSIYFLTLICIHRYFVVVRYKSKSLWKKRSFLRKLCLFVWLILFVQGLPLFFFLKTSVINGSAKCLNIHQSELSSAYFFYNTVLIVPSFLLPLAIFLTYGALLGTAIAKAAKKSSRGKRMKSRSLQMITVSLVIFVVCFGPLHICRTIAVVVKYYGMSCKLLHQVEFAYYTSWVFTMANTCLDPLIYVFANDKFKRSLLTPFKNAGASGAVSVRALSRGACRSESCIPAQGKITCVQEPDCPLDTQESASPQPWRQS